MRNDYDRMDYCLNPRIFYTCSCLFNEVINLKFSSVGCVQQSRSCLLRKVTQLFSIS